MRNAMIIAMASVPVLATAALLCQAASIRSIQSEVVSSPLRIVGAPATAAASNSLVSEPLSSAVSAADHRALVMCGKREAGWVSMDDDARDRILAGRQARVSYEAMLARADARAAATDHDAREICVPLRPTQSRETTTIPAIWTALRASLGQTYYRQPEWVDSFQRMDRDRRRNDPNGASTRRDRTNSLSSRRS